MAKKNIYQIITEQIIELLDKGEIPWRKPWVFTEHKNGKTGHVFNGINPLILDTVASLYGYQSNKWVTFKQMQALGGTFKEGQSKEYTLVVYWHLHFETDDDGKQTDRVAFARPFYHREYNIDQIDWEDESIFDDDDDSPNEDTQVDLDEALFESMADIKVKHGGGKAFYSPSKDYIGMPNPQQFTSDDEYYSTLYHELTHATGHQDRLGRFEGDVAETRFGSQSYSFEELIAEFGAAFLCARTGIDDLRVLENSAAYIASWKQRLTDNPKWWSKASSQARKATEFILGES